MELPNHNKSMFKHSITHKPVRVCTPKLTEQEAFPVPASTIRASDVSWRSSRRLSRTTQALINQRGQREDGLQEGSVCLNTLIRDQHLRLQRAAWLNLSGMCWSCREAAGCRNRQVFLKAPRKARQQRTQQQPGLQRNTSLIGRLVQDVSNFHNLFLPVFKIWFFLQHERCKDHDIMWLKAPGRPIRVLAGL